MKKRAILLIVLIFLGIAGILDAAYLAKLKYTDTESFCDTLQGFDCGTVNKGAYSEFPPWTFIWWVDKGLPSAPNAVLGVIGFVVISMLSLYALQLKDQKKQHKIIKYILALLIISFIYGMYLVYIQKFVLRIWCLFCLVLDAIIILSLIITYILYKRGED
jgi:uncharacterized membrane protein